jgi:hypothetical protein
MSSIRGGGMAGFCLACDAPKIVLRCRRLSQLSLTPRCLFIVRFLTLAKSKKDVEAHLSRGFQVSFTPHLLYHPI